MQESISQNKLSCNRFSCLFMLLLFFSAPLPVNAIRLYNRIKAEQRADSLRKADSLKRIDSRRIADSTLIAGYLKPDKKGGIHIRLYSRSQVEQKTIDSLKVIDSLRIVDSIRVADSIVIARYQQAETTISNEKAANPVVPTDSVFMPESMKQPSNTPTYVDNLSARTIVIDPDNRFADQIDSLQSVIDLKNDALHDNDRHLKKMKVFPVSEKERYINFLLKNKIKDSTMVLAYCTSLYEIYKLKQQLLIAIRNSQDGNTKSFISYHLEEHLRKMGELSELLLSLTPTVPFYPEHKAVQSSPGE